MKTASGALFTLAVMAALFALAGPDMGAEAKTIKYRTHDDWKLSCNTARHMVRERGYNPVKVKSCITRPFSFYAVRKGKTYIVRVDQRTGFVWRE